MCWDYFLAHFLIQKFRERKKKKSDDKVSETRRNGKNVKFQHTWVFLHSSLKTYTIEQTLEGLSSRRGLDSVMSQGWPNNTLIS